MTVVCVVARFLATGPQHIGKQRRRPHGAPRFKLPCKAALAAPHPVDRHPTSSSIASPVRYAAEAATMQPCLSSPPPLAVEHVFYPECSRLLEALTLTGAAGATQPSCAQAAMLAIPLDADGDCTLVAASTSLLPLLEHAVESCEQLLTLRQQHAAASTGKAVLSVLSCLWFKHSDVAAPYAEVAVRGKQALKAAYDAGAHLEEDDIVELYDASSRASRYLWLTPYFGNRFATAVDECIDAGWSRGELALRFVEAWAMLAGQGRFAQLLDKFARLVRAALTHPLSPAQLRRLRDCTRHLPVEMSIELALHARSQPAGCWYTELSHRMKAQESTSW